MLRKEWPLITNTILAQLAAGMFLILTIARLMLASGINQETALQLTSPGILLVGPIIALAMILSLFHLGNPFRAYRSIMNIGKSWLSWEIFFSGLFFLLWLICVYMDRNGSASPFLLSLTALAGILNVFSMANIYFKTGKPGWASAGTFLGFFGSLIILGSLGSALVLANTGMDTASLSNLIAKPIVLAIILLVLEIIFLAALLPKLKDQKNEDDIDLLVSSSVVDEKITGTYRSASIAGWIVSFLGVILLFISLRIGYAGITAILIAFVLVLIGEMLGRCAFFSLGFSK